VPKTKDKTKTGRMMKTSEWGVELFVKDQHVKAVKYGKRLRVIKLS
jgi:hypothetical protein